MRTVAVRALLVAGSLAGAGCSTVLGVDADRYLAGGTDAAGGGAEDAPVSPRDSPADAPPDGPRDGGADAASRSWDCLKSPPEELDPDLHVDVTLQVVDPIQMSTSAGAIDGGPDLDTVTGDWLPGVAIRPCAALDPDCLDAPKAVLTNEAGAASFDLTADFSGFFELHRSDIVPATLYPGRLLAGQTAVSFPAYGIQPKELQDLGLATDTTVVLDPDAGVGHAVVGIYDCQDHQASGVSLAYSASGPRAVPFYFQGGLPSTSATETDGFGLAGVVDVPMGALTVTAVLAADQTPIGSATFDVRPGGLTFALIRVRSH